MASTFEKIEDVVISMGKEATKAAKEVAGNAKSKIDIKSKEYDLKCLYAELGMAYYKDHREDSEYEYDKMTEILDLELELENLKEKK